MVKDAIAICHWRHAIFQCCISICNKTEGQSFNTAQPQPSLIKLAHIEVNNYNGYLSLSLTS